MRHVTSILILVALCVGYACATQFATLRTTETGETIFAKATPEQVETLYGEVFEARVSAQVDERILATIDAYWKAREIERLTREIARLQAERDALTEGVPE